MPAFATWLDDRFPELDLGAAGAPLCRGLSRLARFLALPARLDLRRTILVSDFHPPESLLHDRLGGLPAHIAVPMLPEAPHAGVGYSLLRTDLNPLDWGAETDARVPRELDQVALLLPWDNVHGRTLARWWRQGIRRCWFLQEKRTTGIPPSWAAMAKLVGSRRLFAAAPKAKPEPTQEECRNVWKDAVPTRRSGAPGREPLRITHVVAALYGGGAERQVCNLARMQKEAGHIVRVLTEVPPVGRNGHYLPLLQASQIPVAHAGSELRDHVPGGLDHKASGLLAALARLPRELRRPAADLTGELLTHPADVVHCWLDRTNILGLLAAGFTSTPAVVLSLRNVSPTALPHLWAPWMRPWYRLAAECPAVALVANSQAGARHYEQWLGLPRDGIGLIRNAFVPPPQPTAAQVAGFRRSLHLEASRPTLAGVFRLDPEKRPLFFLEIVAELRCRLPGLQVLLAGAGALAHAVHAEVRRRRLEGSVHLLGQRADVPLILAASQVLLLTSAQEGTPNIVLEASHAGCVPVVTDCGGTSETVIPGVTAHLVDCDDSEGLVKRVIELFGDPEQRLRMAEAGRAFVGDRFAPARVFEETMQLYGTLLSDTRQETAA